LTKIFSHFLSYYGATFLLFGLAVPLSGLILAWLGIKHSILISVFFAVLYFLGLNWLTPWPALIFFLPLVSVIYKILFWPAFHLDFAKNSQGSERGRQVSVVKMIMLAASIIGPLFGGLIIHYFSYPSLFTVVAVLLFISVLPLFFSREIYGRFYFSIVDFYRFLRQPFWRRTEIALVAWGIDELVAGLLWPLFMFLVVAETAVIGGITSASSIIAFLSAYGIGLLADKVGRCRILRWGAVLVPAGWVLRAIARTPVQIGLSDGYYRLVNEGYSIGFYSVLYDRANVHPAEALKVILVREVVMNLSKVLCLVVIGLLVAAFSSLIPAFILAAATSLLTIFI